MLRIAVDGGVDDGHLSNHTAAVEVEDGLRTTGYLDDAVFKGQVINQRLHLVAIDELLFQTRHLQVAEREGSHLVESILIERALVWRSADFNHRTSQCGGVNHGRSRSITDNAQWSSGGDGATHCV